MPDTDEVNAAAQTVPALALHLMQANYREQLQVLNGLVEGFRESAAQRTAELAAVRDGVGSLLSGQWMPTPAAIESALYPSPEQIAAFREAPRG